MNSELNLDKDIIRIRGRSKLRRQSENIQETVYGSVKIKIKLQMPVVKPSYAGGRKT